MPDVFISYARSTEAQALRVAEGLSGLGYDVWRDDQLPAHKAYGDVIQERLEAAKAVVVLWSADAVKSHWVRSEADRARARNKLVQLNIDGADLPMPFDQIQCADLKGWDGDLNAPGWRKAVDSVATLLDGNSPAPTWAPPTAPFPTVSDKPSIAALPFANLSRDPDQDYFVDGLMEEIVTSLTRIRTLFVIAAGSSLSLKGQGVTPLDAARKLGVRYVLEGSVRKAGERVRVAVKLVDAHAGNQIWAERYEDNLDDIFALQDKVALGVAGVIEFSVQNAETLRSIARPTSDLKSYDLYLRALVHFRTYRREDMFLALEMLDRAIELDPKYALALSLAAGAHAIILQFQWSDDPATHARLVMEMVERSVRAGSDDPQVLASAAMAYWTVGDIAAAGQLADRAMSLNPGSSFCLLARGQTRVAMGDLDVAEDCLLRSMQLDPLSPNRSLQLGDLAAVRFAQRRFEEAAELCREWVGIANQPTSVGLLASACGHLGEARAAGEALAHLPELSTISPAEIAAIIYQKAEHRDLFLEGLALAKAFQPPAARPATTMSAPERA